MNSFEEVQERIKDGGRTWLVTGAAGFIGSNLVETLLKLDQQVVGLDNFSTGKRGNLEQVRAAVSEAQWQGLRFMEADIRSMQDCRAACAGVDVVLHQAALGSVPRSIDDPVTSNENNVTGFLNMLTAARDAGVSRFVYAASSAAYGDHPALPKVEANIGNQLSPYAVTKYVNELYAGVFARCYGFKTIGLRYFNVFGPRQDPDGPYAAVIPKWIAAMLRGESVYINGDGSTARDFCYVDNAVQANLLAATTQDDAALDQIYNVAVNAQTSLTELFGMIRTQLATEMPELQSLQPEHRDFRQGDVRFSLADISKARSLLKYQPAWRVEQGLQKTVNWYFERLGMRAPADVDAQARLLEATALDG